MWLPQTLGALVAVAARAEGATTDEFLLKGKGELPSDETIAQAVAQADIALIGMSSPAKNASLELAFATKMVEAGKPIALFADTFGAWNRKWFMHLREHVSIVFTASTGERVRARDLFPAAAIFGHGNPVWDPYFLPASRAEARQKMGVRDDEFVMLAPGTKGAAANILLWGTIAEAMTHPEGGLADQPLRLLLARHPGDKNDPVCYQSLLDLAGDTRIVYLPEGLKSDDAIPGVDCVLHLGNSSVGLHALCRKIPVIECPAPLVDKYVMREIGGWEYAPVTSQATEVPDVQNPMGLANLISHVRMYGSQRASADFLPPREQGACAHQIAMALIDAAS